MQRLLNVLRATLPTLYLTADGFNLLIRQKNLRQASFIHVDVRFHVCDLAENPPHSADDLYERLNLVDEDDEY